MSSAIRSVVDASPEQAPLAARIARAAGAVAAQAPAAAVVDKVKLCLYDLIGCAFEARTLPWSTQALALAERSVEGGASVIGAAYPARFGDAAFVNAVQGHGLVREDMHSGSISHLGIVVLPVLLALSEYRRVSGKQFITAAMIGYEVGAQIGKALMDAEVARIHRPTGITGPVAGAAAGAQLLRLSEEQFTHALALGANCTQGFNQWAHTGGSEMFFQAGFAARNGLSAARLAEAGAFASPSALDGEAGLFASLHKRASAARVALFQSEPEILSVYHKPVPACNFAQTPCQAALALTRENRIAPERIAAITVRVPRAGALYPGCDYAGPFAHVLQAKMSIQYNVAAALLKGSVSEANFALLREASLARLIALTKLEIDPDLTQAYPGKQGGEVEIRASDGDVHKMRLADVVNANASDVRARFRSSAEQVIGPAQARQVEAFIDDLEHSEDCGALGGLLRARGQ